MALHEDYKAHKEEAERQGTEPMSWINWLYSNDSSVRKYMEEKR